MKQLVEYLKKNNYEEVFEVYKSYELFEDSMEKIIDELKKSINSSMDNLQFHKLKELNGYFETASMYLIELRQSKLIWEYEDEMQVKKINDEQKLTDDNYVNVNEVHVWDKDNVISQSLHHDFDRATIVGFQIWDIKRVANSWKELFLNTCEILYSHNAESFSQLLDHSEMQGRTYKYFSYSEKDVILPEKINNSNIYTTTIFSKTMTQGLIKKILEIMDIDSSSFLVFIEK